jgi:hypothetical protein
LGLEENQGIGNIIEKGPSALDAGFCRHDHPVGAPGAQAETPTFTNRLGATQRAGPIPPVMYQQAAT